ncbi:MAG: NAD(P)/FAD-dependent oxidoreductase [Bacteroidetes bacterium]|nr:NAD(P)/FAD-dependent oxidoreductase [Bacteroidota bacterium]
MPVKVNIIGAGIAGLSAGCYLQMNGFETEIFEMHSLPGGLCTSWEKDGYSVNGCLHWLVGSSPSDPFYNLWNELIDMKTLKFVDSEEYFRVEDKQGKVIRVFTDIERLEKELKEKAPEDEAHINEFISAVRKMSGFSLPIEKPQELLSLWEGFKVMIRLLPYLGSLNKWSKIPAADYAARCSNPLLRKMFEFAFLPEMSMLFIIFTFVWMSRKSAGYPIGGSLNFSRLIEKRYLELGGKINYHHKVNRILVSQKKEKQYASGLGLSDKRTFLSDYVISAADGYSTIFEMLKGHFVDHKIRFYFRKFSVFPSYIQVSLGVKRTFEGEPSAVYFPLPEPMEIDTSITTDFLGYHLYNFDPTLAPQGSTLITAMLETYHYEYWNRLRDHDRQKYKDQKQRLANKVIGYLDKKLGGIKENLEMVDVSTPATVIRYTNNWKGSFEGWLMTKESGLSNMRKTLPGLEHFYMAGQWVEPGGGVPAALFSGRNAAQLICKKEKKKFKTVRF